MNKKELVSLLDKVFLTISTKKEISSELYALLVTLFPLVLNPALDILDNGKVTQFICQDSKRCFYRVREPSSKQSSSSNNNNAFGASTKNGAGYADGSIMSGGSNESNEAQYDIKGEFCFCYYFARECLNEKGSSFFCKHILAAKLAQVLETVHVQVIEDNDFAPLYLQNKAHLIKYDDKKQYS